MEQESRIHRALTQSFFLIVHTETAKKTEFKLSGSTGNLYTITMQFGKMGCDCPDFRQVRKKLFCKHMCWLYLKVFNRPLGDIGKQILVSDIKINTTAFNARYIKQFEQSVSGLASAIINPEKLKSDCAICYEDFKSNQGVKACDTCSNIVHTGCFEKWQSFGNKSCVYCRANIANASLIANGNYLQFRN